MIRILSGGIGSGKAFAANQWAVQAQQQGMKIFSNYPVSVPRHDVLQAYSTWKAEGIKPREYRHD